MEWMKVKSHQAHNDTCLEWGILAAHKAQAEGIHPTFLSCLVILNLSGFGWDEEGNLLSSCQPSVWTSSILTLCGQLDV